MQKQQPILFFVSKDQTICLFHEKIVKQNGEKTDAGVGRAL